MQYIIFKLIELIFREKFHSSVIQLQIAIIVQPVCSKFSNEMDLKSLRLISCSNRCSEQCLFSHCLGIFCFLSTSFQAVRQNFYVQIYMSWYDNFLVLCRLCFLLCTFLLCFWSFLRPRTDFSFFSHKLLITSIFAFSVFPCT